MRVIGFLLLTAALSWYEVVRIRRYGGGKREMVAYSVLMLLAAAVGVVLILGLPFPNPIRLIDAVLKPLGERVVGSS